MVMGRSQTWGIGLVGWDPLFGGGPTVGGATKGVTYDH